MKHCHQVQTVFAWHTDYQAKITSLPLFLATHVEQIEVLGHKQIVRRHMKQQANMANANMATVARPIVGAIVSSLAVCIVITRR